MVVVFCQHASHISKLTQTLVNIQILSVFPQYILFVPGTGISNYGRRMGMRLTCKWGTSSSVPAAEERDEPGA